MKETYKFKTTINCGGCVARVTPALNKIEGIDSWNVDTSNPDKILTVEANGATEQQIISSVQALGFDIEKI
ncbi:copper chaperone [Dysgonomonas sp. 216]|uniref:heavy-metal-associated domain-containing protein n=1 Tax=Dysgonomonas sp. 216 TaxID=2302934 RepID=UPI0013D4377B|nr:heavy-metal-associated domain-containing protein [Dysgonomonas sp. 216]NDW18933.1 copper chaperone [Dysgonomonas sp. 216]